MPSHGEGYKALFDWTNLPFSVFFCVAKFHIMVTQKNAKQFFFKLKKSLFQKKEKRKKEDHKSQYYEEILFFEIAKFRE